MIPPQKMLHFLKLFCFYATINLIGVTILYAQQGVKGKVTNNKGEPIGFVTIYHKELKKGTNSNEDGTFEFVLPKGSHEIIFQSVGYKTQLQLVTVNDNYTQLNVKLDEQAYSLKEVKVSNGGTNPAVWIMRKAIAAAPYYRRQVLMYTAKVYIKGSGKLDNVPFLFEKALKKEGIEEGKTFLTESINEVSFKQPNTYKEKALSVKSSFPIDGAPEPMQLLRGSMYHTDMDEVISPLSPQAFSVYNFTLEGSFYEGKREVNRIKVTPKRKGKDVMTGYLYIIEGLWCLHSTDLKSSSNFNTRIITSFQPISGYDYVWMPVTYDIQVAGSFLGFSGSFRYLASASNYQITLNPNLDHKWVQQQAKEQKADIPKIAETKEVTKPEAVKPKTKRQQQIDELLAKDELTKMEMLKLANKMKLESELQQQNREIIPDSSSISIDSLAFKRDTAFWKENRTVALMENEVQSYKQADSIVMAKEQDTSYKKPKHKSDSSFYWLGLLTGDRYLFNKKKHFINWSGFIGNGSDIFVNTVDGWGAVVLLKVGSNSKANGKDWSIANTIRVPFERKALNTTIKAEYWYKPRTLGQLAVSGGSTVSDFNRVGGASSIINTGMLLLDKRNLQKLYQYEFINAYHQIEIMNGLLWKTNLSWQNRYMLGNISRYASKESYTEKITPNTPIPFYMMPTHQVVLISNQFYYTPYQRYRIYKEKKYYAKSKWPTFGVTIENAIPNILGSDVNYMKSSFSIQENIQPLHWLEIDARIQHQFFIYQRKAYFPDFNHAIGNISPVLLSDPSFVFRNLPYYQYSNTGSLTSAHATFNLKRILVKRLPLLNMTDIKELVFYNGLYSSTLPSYQELGYGVDNVLGFIRADVFAGFKANQYSNWGVRLILTVDWND